MQSLAEITAARMSEIIAKSDNILADLQRLGVSNDVVYALINGAKIWLIRLDNGADCGGIDECTVFCVKAKTREDAMRQFLKIAPRWIFYSYLRCRNEQKCKDLVEERYKLWNSINNGTQIDSVDVEKRWNAIIAENADFIIDLLINNTNKALFDCSELIFNKIY